MLTPALAPSALRLVFVAVFCAGLWIPFLQWFAAPDRTMLLGNAGRFLVIATAVIQVVTVVTSAILLLVAADSGQEGAGVAGALVGWIGFLAAPVWAYWVSFSLVDYPPAVPDERIVFVVICALLAVPSAIPSSRPVLRVGASLVATGALLLASALLVARGPAVTTIAPTTIYAAGMIASCYFVSARASAARSSRDSCSTRTGM